MLEGAAELVALLRQVPDGLPEPAWLVDARAFADLAPPRTVSGDHERWGERRCHGPAPGTRRIP